jgi:agmatinase
MLNEAQKAATSAAIYPQLDENKRASLPVSALSIAERAWELVLQLNPQARLLTLGGDHSTAWPAVKALHDAGRRFCILQFDAHTDLLPHRLGVRMCFATWSFHANDLVGRQRRLVQVGIRASRFDKAHWEGTLDVAQFWAADINADVHAATTAIVDAVRATGLPVFISNDIDGTDAAFASAAGTPEGGGLHPDVINDIIARVGAVCDVVGADLMEVAPVLEVNAPGTTLHTAVRYLQTTLQTLLARP